MKSRVEGAGRDRKGSQRGRSQIKTERRGGGSSEDEDEVKDGGS